MGECVVELRYFVSKIPVGVKERDWFVDFLSEVDKCCVGLKTESDILKSKDEILGFPERLSELKSDFYKFVFDIDRKYKVNLRPFYDKKNKVLFLPFGGLLRTLMN